MKFHSTIYWGESINDKAKVKWKLKHSKKMLNIFLITLCNGSDQLEIFHNALLIQHVLKEQEIYVIGIAGSYEEAVSIVVHLTDMTYSANGDGNIKQYILNKDA